MKKYIITFVTLYCIFFANPLQAQSFDSKLAVWEIKGGHARGTGFFIDERHFVTAFHVIEGVLKSQNSNRLGNFFSNLSIKYNTKYIFLSQDDNPNIFKIKRIAGLSYIYDLAILEIEGKASHYLSLQSFQFKHSKSFIVLGYADQQWKELKIQSLQPNLDRIFSYNISFLHSKDLSGMSGGPVIDNKGRVAAVFTSSSVEPSNIRAVKTRYLKKMIEDIYQSRPLNISSKSAERVFLNEKKQVYNLAVQGDSLYQYIVADKLLIIQEQAFFLSLMKELDENITDSEKARFYWLEKAAKNGLAIAQYELAAQLYLKGGYIDQSLYWMRKSARQGYAPAQYLLAVSNEGRRNFSESFYGMRKSARQGYAPAQYELALMYKEGKGVKQNLIQTKNWMRKSARQGYAPAQYELALMYKEGAGGGERPSFYWMKKSAEQNEKKAQYELALMYKEGKGVKKDLKSAINWLEKVANTGNYLALYELAEIYSQKRNFKLASEFFIQAEEQKNASPMERIFLNLQKNEEDPAKIFKEALTLSETLSHFVAEYKLARMYATGKGTKPQPQLAFKWMKESANKGYAPAQYELAQMYAKGEGTKSQPSLASYWLEKAFAGNHPLALEEFNSCYNNFSTK